MPSNWTIIKITVSLELWVFIVYLTDCFIENYGARPFIRNYYGAENVYGLSTFLYGSRIRRHLLNGTISIFSGQLNVFDCPGARLTDHVLWKYNNTTFRYLHGNRFYPFGVAFVFAPAEESDSGLYECYVDHKLRGSAMVDVTMKAKVLIAVFLGYFILLVTALSLKFYFWKLLFFCPKKIRQLGSSSGGETENVSENYPTIDFTGRSRPMIGCSTNAYNDEPFRDRPIIRQPINNRITTGERIGTPILPRSVDRRCTANHNFTLSSIEESEI
uniref:Ig-like domain-containing protein n=1 Tax=Panagrellus redivivus TaxID=6233 RepID=A0A7E4W4C8_PANRE